MILLSSLAKDKKVIQQTKELPVRDSIVFVRGGGKHTRMHVAQLLQSVKSAITSREVFQGCLQRAWDELVFGQLGARLLFAESTSAFPVGRAWTS